MHTKHQYAWLEHDGEIWHFISSLFADPEKSTRRWFDEQCALDELTGEGWAVVRAYPEVSDEQPSGNRVYGYGLRRKVASSHPSETRHQDSISPISAFERLKIVHN